MRIRLLLLILPLLTVSCVEDLDYDISDAAEVPVINAMWNASEQTHDVFLCTSGAYKVNEPKELAHIYCYINGYLAAETEEFETVNTSRGITFHKYSLNAPLRENDKVRLVVKIADTELFADATVPASPTVTIDTVSVDKTYRDYFGRPVKITRDYTITMTVEDPPEDASFYRLYYPGLHVESHRIDNGQLKNTQDFNQLPVNEDDPVFNNVPIHFPEEIMLELPFLGGSVTNSNHVFTDELFEGGSHSFVFDIPESQYLPGSAGTGEYITYDARFRLACISWNEYVYLLSANAASSIYADPMAEPVVMPSNINNGLGIFSINNTYDKIIRLENQSWPEN